MDTKRVLFRIPTPLPFLKAHCDTPVATRCPNIPVGLPSEPVGLSLSGYESFEPGIGLGGLVPTLPRPNHRYHPTAPIFRVVIFWFSPAVSLSTRASVWLGSLLNCSAPPLPFHRSPFPSLYYFVPCSLNPPGLVRDLSNEASDPSTASSPTT